FAGQPIALEGPVQGAADGKTEIGIRPEFVSLEDQGLPATVTKVSDVGRHTVVECEAGGCRINAVTEGGAPDKGSAVHLAFRQDMTRLYVDGWIATSPAADEQGAA
ncbi:MAG: TOBE domain-containing protein, partial [Leisingera sp.]